MNEEKERKENQTLLVATEGGDPVSPVKAPHRFKKGQSGNLRGRPKGGKNRATLLQEAVRQNSEALIIRHLPKIVEEVCKQAREGNMIAAKMILDRAIPVKRAVEVTGKDGGDFGVKIIIENLVTYETKEQDVEDAEVIEDA